jgi:hypothetical protein
MPSDDDLPTRQPEKDSSSETNIKITNRMSQLPPPIVFEDSRCDEQDGEEEFEAYDGSINTTDGKLTIEVGKGTAPFDQQSPTPGKVRGEPPQVDPRPYPCILFFDSLRAHDHHEVCAYLREYLNCELAAMREKALRLDMFAEEELCTSHSSNIEQKALTGQLGNKPQSSYLGSYNRSAKFPGCESDQGSESVSPICSYETL